MNPFMFPSIATGIFGRHQVDQYGNPIDPQQSQGGQFAQVAPPMPQLPQQQASYDPSEPMNVPFGLKMNRGQVDYMKDLGAGIGRAFDNPAVQALSYANEKKDQRRSYDREGAQRDFENQLKLLDAEGKERDRNAPKWKEGSMYGPKGEQKGIYDERDPIGSFRPWGDPKPIDPGTLYKVVGKNGVTYESAENAVGQTPYEKPDRAQPGFSVTTNADGTTSISYGEGVTGGPQKPTVNDLEKKILQGGDQMARLREMNNRFDAQYLTFQGQADNWWNTTKEKAGIGLSPEAQQKVTEYSAFQRDVTNNLSLYLNQLSGAAISVQEAERIGKSLPNMDDSPTKFRAKMGATMRDLSKSQARAKWALQNGVGQNPWESDAKFADAVEQRGDQIKQQIRQQNPKASEEEIDRAVDNQIRMEFGF